MSFFLFQGLKSHWDEVFSEFQSLPLFSSSQKVLKRKSELEGALKELDRDIKLFTRTGPLFVADVAKSRYL
jgi:DNA polymerase III delta subunit